MQGLNKKLGKIIVGLLYLPKKVEAMNLRDILADLVAQRERNGDYEVHATFTCGTTIRQANNPDLSIGSNDMQTIADLLNAADQLLSLINEGDHE